MYFFQEVVGVFQLEILELNENFGIPAFNRTDNLFHKVIILLCFQPRLFDSQIIRIIDQLLICSSDIETNRQYSPRMKPSPSHIKIQFSNGNLKSSDSEIAETEDPTSVGDHDCVHLGLRPVVDHRSHFLISNRIYKRYIRGRLPKISSLEAVIATARSSDTPNPLSACRL